MEILTIASISLNLLFLVIFFIFRKIITFKFLKVTKDYNNLNMIIDHKVKHIHFDRFKSRQIFSELKYMNGDKERNLKIIKDCFKRKIAQEFADIIEQRNLITFKTIDQLCYEGEFSLHDLKYNSPEDIVAEITILIQSEKI